MATIPITKRGAEKLKTELHRLKTVERPAVITAIAEARAQGDLSENFEYHAAKRAHGRLLSRISYMQKTLRFARVMDTSRLDNDTVGLLRRVEITNLATNTTMAYTIVNPHEANVKEGKISIKSPIAHAMLNKKAGDTVEVTVPAGKLSLRIESGSL